jgi:hypothetical protein
LLAEPHRITAKGYCERVPVRIENKLVGGTGIEPMTPAV